MNWISLNPNKKVAPLRKGTTFMHSFYLFGTDRPKSLATLSPQSGSAL